MTDKKLTEIICLVDRSGSMQSVADDAIGGFNAFLKEQQASKHGKCLLTYVQFDSQGIDIVHESKPVNDVPELTRETFVPRGGTPLREAMCTIIDSTGNRFAAVAENRRPGNVVFVVITDGQENSSGREYTEELLKEKVRVQSEKYDWTFVFLAQNIDAFIAGSRIGLSNTNRKHFVARTSDGAVGAAQGYYVASAGISNLRAKGCCGQSLSFSHQDKEELSAASLIEDSARAVVLTSTEDSLDGSSSSGNSSE